MAATVTIAKTYFNALLRRAETHTDGILPPQPPFSSITISQAEYAHLNRQAREYNVLRSALLRGGLNEASLDILISGADVQDPEDAAVAPPAWGADTFARPAAVPVRITRPTAPDNEHKSNPIETALASNGFLSSQQSWRVPNGRANSFGAIDSTVDDVDDSNGDPQTPPHGQDQRTLHFQNLPEGTTHADLLKVIKGGRLLDIHVRGDRSATVSFSEGANDFLLYTKKKDLYMGTKRISVRWNDRQFKLPNHVANKISGGATRNLVIRNGKSKDLNEQIIRDDMEHIHNLVVISVYENHKSGDIFVSTNSVHNALFARTCMMSRSMYKGLKIEYYPDECAAPIPKLPDRAPAPPPSVQAKSANNASTNNFYALLNADDDNESDISSEDTQSQAPLNHPGGVKINWADSVAVA